LENWNTDYAYSYSGLVPIQSPNDTDYAYSYSGLLPIQSPNDFTASVENIRITRSNFLFARDKPSRDRSTYLIELEVHKIALGIDGVMRGYANHNAFAALSKAKHAETNAAKVKQYEINKLATDEMALKGFYSAEVMGDITKSRTERKIRRAKICTKAREAREARESVLKSK